MMSENSKIKRYNERVTRYIREGRGSGNLAGYKPWLTVRSFSSKAGSYRIDGKTGRTHHLFSSGEFKIFTVLNGSPLTTDIREQFPLLPLSDTVSIAGALGVAHPKAHTEREKMGEKINVVMTTDFLVDLEDKHGLPTHVAISVKSSQDIDGTTQAKLTNLLNKAEIERRYWSRRKVQFLLITAEDVPATFLDNMILLNKYRKLNLGDLPAPAAELSDHLLDRILAAPGREVRAHCMEFDKRMELNPGTGLSLAWHNVATQAWSVDMLQPLAPTAPLSIWADTFPSKASKR